MKPRSVLFEAVLLRFGSMGEKTGWTYVDIPAETALKINPGVRKGYRVKGKIDGHAFKGKSILPMGEGAFIFTVDAAMRKAIGKRHGALVTIELSKDQTEYVLNALLMECLQDDPAAWNYFNSLPRSHRNYFSKWVDSAKTDQTVAKRISRIVMAMSKKQGFAEMMRESKMK